MVHAYSCMYIYLIHSFILTGVLPLDPKNSVAVIGPNSNATTTMQGNYHVNNYIMERFNLTIASYMSYSPNTKVCPCKLSHFTLYSV